MTTKSLILFALTFALGSPTYANTAKQAEEASLYRVTFKYADCVVRRAHDDAAYVIVNNLGSDAILRHYKNLISDSCLEKIAEGQLGLRFSDYTYRFALANALVKADFSNKAVGNLSDRSPLIHPLAMSEAEYLARRTATKGKRALLNLQEDYEKQNAMQFLSRFGECVAKRDSNGSLSLLMTDPTSPEEKAALSAMLPSLAQCLSSGRKVKFPKSSLRGGIAYGFYRLAKAPPMSAAGKAN